MTDAPLIPEIRRKWKGSLLDYLVGGLLAFLLTGLSFFIIYAELLSGYQLVIALLTIAVTQVFVQLIFFLHLAKESKPFWKTLILILAVVILLIILLGTFWIMHSLDTRVMHGG